MDKKINLALIVICAFAMSSCTKDEYISYPAYSYVDITQRPYNIDSYNMANYNYGYQQKQQVNVPNSYHVGELHSPVSFKDRDETWVNSQNPKGYTIELTEGDKASQVAQVLYKAPKKDRMAQVKYERDGKTRYRGVYGTFGTPEEAQKALNSLPPELKSSASVINWSSVQQQ
ncbi:SPOR domain-containing protein [Legionella sp. PATHC035]|uniref:SPOR domain-containing protein n=1 Tax=Legionella sp. PATHC035 TaxID=2992040 RepID=UPI0022447D90|nr:SPOR domain-containing protein [Legionella sp. PATHC035]MCW8407806.1 SPOR domain-containing protein [Legionella sp. PATHC035]